jgi:hypothetical protein
LPVVGLGCHKGTMLEKGLCEFDVSPARRPMQWSLSSLGLGCRIRAVLEKEAYDFDIPLG